MLTSDSLEEDEAETLILQILLKNYLEPSEGAVWTVEDACLTVRRIGNRSGVPADAATWLYRVQHPGCGWTVDLRAVWRSGMPMRPWGTHIAVVNTWDDEDRYDHPAAVRSAFREWLRALPL